MTAAAWMPRSGADSLQEKKQPLPWKRKIRNDEENTEFQNCAYSLDLKNIKGT